MKLWLIQDLLSPYRIELFKQIARTKNVDFKLIILTKGARAYPQWKFDLTELPFKAERTLGLATLGLKCPPG